MKYIRYWFIIILFVFSLTGEVTGQVSKHSFRLRGLGENLFGFVDDLYSDLHINPAYITRFQKTHVFTNLSNLQSGDNYSIFEQSSEGYAVNPTFPSNMLGGIFKYKNYPIGLFLETSGYNMSTFYEETDTDYYDLKTGVNKYHYKKFNGDFSARSLTLFTKFQDWGIMFGYSHGGFGIKMIDRNRNSYFTIPDTANVRVVGEQDYQNTEKEVELPSSKISFVVGKIFKKTNTELSISGGFRPEKIRINSDDIFSTFNQPISVMDSTDYSKFKDFDLGIVELGVKSMFINLRYKKTFPGLKSFSQLNYLFNFTRYSLPIKINSHESVRQDSLVPNGIIPTKVIKNENTEIKSEGSAVIYKLMVGIGGEKYFDNLNSMAAMGIKFYYLWGDVDFNQNPGETLFDYSRITDDPVNDINYTNKISDEKYIKTNGKGSAAMLTIPVGLETKLHKKFTIRFGASTWLPLKFSGTWDIKTEDNADSLMSSTLEDFEYEPETILPESKNKVAKSKGSFINLTTYHFGATYQVSESISIDLLHFARLTELNTWWLSVNLKF